ncbi:MAG TPA: glycerol-3-phosphate 1-O-acyltransferase PlsY [Opitutaceae bacterium]
MLIPVLIVAVIGYLLGALPFGYLVARAHGVNIFEVGSKNPGATNVRRVLGAKAGNLVFALDALKGALASAWALLARTEGSVSYDLEEWGLSTSGHISGGTWISLGVVGLAGSLIGHSFSCFTRFKGGKGVATAAGGFLVVAPTVVLAGAAAWAATFYSTRYVSLASMLAGAVLPLAAWFTGQPTVVLVLTLLVALFVIIRHRANISRLLAGTEPKTGGNKQA